MHFMHEKDFFYLMFNNMPCSAIICKLYVNEEGSAIDFVITGINDYLTKREQPDSLQRVGKKASDYLGPDELLRWLNRFITVAASGKTTHFSEYSEVLQTDVSGTVFSFEKDSFIVMFILK